MKLRFLVFFFLAASTVFAQGSKKDYKTSLKNAKEHLRYEEFQQAMPYVQELLQEDGNNAYYNFWMGKCLYLSYKKNQALPFFEKVEKTNPDVDKEFYYWYGLTLHYNLYFDRAVDAYRKDLERYEPASSEYVWVNNRITQCLYAKKLAKKADAEQVKIENMGDRINSEFSEHSPVISANDSVLLYTARRPECLGANQETYFYDEDIYISRKKNGEWSEGVNIGKPVNAVGHDATISLTADGQTLYIYRHKKAGGLYVTQFDQTEQKWREPKSVERPLNSKYYEASICASADSSLMFFTSDRPGGFGGRDIYMVKREGKNKWTEPINLGSSVNTAFDEDAPYFHPDGKTLYYSSNGPGSMGGFDIFVTEMADPAQNTWLDPLNMGAPVNTPDDDIYFVLAQDGRSGYYTSGMEGGYGEKDIYHIMFPYYPYPRRYHIVELAGLVRDVQTLDTLQAMVKLVDVETNQVLDSVLTGTDSSRYYFILEPQRSYSLVVVAEGYNSATEDLSTPVLEDEDVFLEKNLFLNKPTPMVEETPRQRLELQNIYYDFDKDFIRPDAAAELDRAVELLAQNPNLKIKLLSHTDWYGTYSYNVDLSSRRAKNARAYLVKKGIDPNRILMDHFSENRPLESNDNDNGRQYNRRTELRLIEGNEVVLTSQKLRSGVNGVEVDHTTPKGEAGFDNPQGIEFNRMVANGSSSESSQDEESLPTSMEVMKDAIKEEAPLTGKDAIKAEAILTGKDAIKAGVMAAAEEDDADAAFYEELNALEFRNIYFDFDKFNLRETSKAQLTILEKYLARHTDVTLEIWGHTDAFGSVEYNQQLSENRATSAYEYLQAKGLTNIALMTKGFSELDPVDTNDNAGGRQNNRRVEFRLMRNGKVIAKSIP